MPTPDRDVIITFQQRRQRMLQGFGACMILLALALICMQLADMSPSLLGMGKAGWRGVAGVQLLVGVGVALCGVLQYRCPVCHHTPRSHRSPLGLAIDPNHCAKCGARLR